MTPREAHGVFARPGVDFGYRAWIVTVFRWSFRAPQRYALVSSGLVLLSLALAGGTLGLGNHPLPIGEIVDVLTGTGRRFSRIVVLQWRLPVAIAAVVFGALLGLGGAIFQSLTRNPLGSPDIIGFDAGSYTAVVVAMLWFGIRNHWTLAAASVGGGLMTAFVVYALSHRRGLAGFRLIIVGIGVTAMLGSLNSYLITRAHLREAMAVGFWGAGSLTRVGWPTLTPVLLCAAFIGAGAIVLAPDLTRLELGDDAAATLGTRPGPVRLGAIVVGVATSALVTAAAGPIAFIALIAPQLARRLTRSAGVSPVAAAAMGAVLLASAHAVSLVVGIWLRPVPVGLVTVCVGGTYLLCLLVRETRRQREVLP